MGQFNAKITAEYNPPRKWIMKKDLTYTCTNLTDDEKIIALDMVLNLLMFIWRNYL